MPPKKRDKAAEAAEAEEAAAAKLSRAIFDDALDARMVARARPSSVRELVPSKLLRRSDCKDIHKKSSTRKNRYMTVFPGQLAALREGRIGSLAKLDSQNPVLYVEYAGLGRLKLQGTIVRSRTTRYFTLNVKSKDRMNLEDWFDSVIIFSRFSWVGTAEENPGEEPLPFPESLKHVQEAAEAEPSRTDAAADASVKPGASPLDPVIAKALEERERAEAANPKPKTDPSVVDFFAGSVAAEEGAKPMLSVVEDDGGAAAAAMRSAYPAGDGKSPAKAANTHAIVVDDEDDDDDEDEDDGGGGGGRRASARPQRESAKAMKYTYDDDDEMDDDEDDDDDAAQVFRGKAAERGPAPAQLFAPVFAKAAAKPTKPKPAAKSRASVDAVTKAQPPAKKSKAEKKKEVISIDDDEEEEEGGDEEEEEEDDDEDDDVVVVPKQKPLRRASASASEAKRKRALEESDEEDEEDESESELEEEEDDDSDFDA